MTGDARSPARPGRADRRSGPRPSTPTYRRDTARTARPGGGVWCRPRRPVLEWAPRTCRTTPASGPSCGCAANSTTTGGGSRSVSRAPGHLDWTQIPFEQLSPDELQSRWPGSSTVLDDSFTGRAHDHQGRVWLSSMSTVPSPPGRSGLSLSMYLAIIVIAIGVGFVLRSWWQVRRTRRAWSAGGRSLTGPGRTWRYVAAHASDLAVVARGRHRGSTGSRRGHRSTG